MRHLSQIIGILRHHLAPLLLSFIRSLRRSQTAHASSDYWDQTGEKHLPASISLQFHTCHTHVDTHLGLLTLSLMSHH